MAHHQLTVTLPPVVAQAVATIALGLLGASGVAKVVDPEPTSGALDAARLPSSPWVARGLGVFELAVAVAGLLAGGPALVLGALLYTGFALFTLAAVRNNIPIQSCGCFGRDDTPPTMIHVGYNVVAAISLAWLAASGSAPIDWGLPAVELALWILFAAIGVYASYLLLARLPLTLGLVRAR